MRKIIRKCIAVVLSLAMIVTVVPMTAGAAEYSGTTGFTEEAVQEEAPQSEADYTNSSPEAEAEPVAELKELRGENEKHFLMSDKTIKAVIYSQPVHYEKNGEWVDIDNSLVPEAASDSEDIDGYVNNDNDVKIKIAKDTGSDKLVSIKKDNYSISWGYADDADNESAEADADPKQLFTENFELNTFTPQNAVIESTDKSDDLICDSVTDSTQAVKFNNVDAGCDLEYIITGRSVKENIIVAWASESYTYSFDIQADNLELSLTEEGSINCVNAYNEVIYRIPAPYMYDSKHEISDAAAYSLAQIGDGEYRLTVTADQEWMNAEERAYPVTIDPIVTQSVSNTLISARTVTSSTSYSSPLQADSGKKVVMNYSLPSLNGAYIEEATLNLFTSSSPNTVVNVKEVIADNGGTSYTASSIVSDSLLCGYGATNSFNITKPVSNAYLNGKSSVAVEISTSSSGSVTLDNSNISGGGMLVVRYNNFEGIDPNISYHTQDVGKAGTSYINDITGNHLIVRNDIGTDGNVLPVSIDMVYNRNNIAADYLLAEPYGRGWNCSYYYRLRPLTSDDCDYYLVDASGRKIFFSTEDNEIWTDEDSEGYELAFSTPGALLGATISTPNGEVYTLDTYGRVTKIESRTFKDNGLTNAILITYSGSATSSTGNRITSITDGAGRKYNFVYSSNRLSAINYVGTGTTVLKTVSYTYSQYMTSSIYRLTGVSYTGGSAVSYQYDSGAAVSKMVDSDGYSISFSGSNRVNSISEASAKNTAGGKLNMVYGGNRTVFYDNNGNYEYEYFDAQGNAASLRDEKGNAIFAEYGGRGQLNKISDQKSTNADFIADNNLITNGDLTVSNIQTSGTASLSSLSGWTFSGTTASDKAVYASGQTAIPNYDASRVMLNGSITGSKTMSQIVSVSDGKAGDEYSFGGWSIGYGLPLHTEITNNARTWGMTLEFISSGGTITQVESFNYNPNDDSWQYLRSEAMAEYDYAKLRLTVKYVNQANPVYFDGIELLKTGTNIVTEETEEEPSTDSPEDDEIPAPTFNSQGIKTYTSTDDNGVTFNESVDRYENSLSSVQTDGTKSISTSNGYSANGNYQTSQTDEAGNKTSYTYDSQSGLLTSVTDANNTSTGYTYNTAGQLTQSSCGNTVNNYSYENDRLKKITTNSQSYYFTYDEWGNQTGVKVGQNETDAVSLITYVYETAANGGKLTNITYGNNQIISYTYDNEDKPTAIKINGKTRYTLQYKYGEIKSVTDLELNTKTVYTESGTELYSISGTTETLKYSSNIGDDGTYTDDFRSDTFSRKSTQNDDGTTTIDYKHDGELYAKQTLAYDVFGRLTSSDMASGENADITQLHTSYKYRDVSASKTTNQISSITYTSFHSSLRGANAKTISYTYNNLGHINSVTDASGTTTYYYDGKGQLTRVDDAAQNYTFLYTYNNAGNVTLIKKCTFGTTNTVSTVGYNYDSVWKDKLTYCSILGSITYDAIGNPITYGSNSFAWTAGRQLESVTNSNNSISYKYDSNGIRTQKTVNGETTEYIWSNDGKLLQQKDCYGNKMFFHYDENGEPIGVNYYGAEYAYLKNAQGDIIGLTIPSGRLVAEYKYDAWGKLISVTGSMAENIGIDNPLRYRGYYYDNETGYYYLQSRYYDPTIGRFINADDTSCLGVTGTELSYNLFAYCENNPVNFIDLDGHTPIQAVFAAIGLVAGWHLGDYVAKKLGYKSGWKYWAIRTGVVVGGGVIGWFAGGSLAAVIKGFIFSSPKLIASTPLWIYKFLGIATGSGSVVLGRYPTYLALAQRLGSNIFSIASNVWNSMSTAAQWAANRAFLDKAIQAGQKFTLSANAYKAIPGTYFYKEIQYLLSHGYKIARYGWEMIKK